ncbi:cyclic nucleotide-binding domain protein (macronuclear) [Tetrahymena thermophila SB210]|uniref:Cyclic nucleotide-binding domain protein n=1 Tax=Tetrahymena thermophila (strain SB210) TaxID=312017 RepID=Q22U34_TETTS|nr:cyclic nucleotide-binding domain protein [Tetrahymena thermophila SB210]EAR88853.2 cyclic nucleotide-binding domain protein [Tetrahymena thermophila SB210]|eukprot:XP_001009098.2 cyclic nucleotide-binding domain protein [Tetrahymena thermophila SB210]
MELQLEIEKSSLNQIQEIFYLFILVFYSIAQSYNGSLKILRYLDYITFIKYLDIPQKVTEFETKLQLNDSIKNWMKLLKLEITVLILVHVACCIFLDIGQFESQQNQDSWLNKFDLDNSSIQQQYFSSLYFMVITICTIGYGDISPYTFNERLFIIIIAILSTNVTAYTFSQISEIVKFEDNKNESFNKLMTGINYQMKVGGLSMKLQQKVRKFYQYFHIQSQNSQNFANQFMNQLPQNLQEEVLLDLNKESINSIYLFKSLSNKCQQKISLQIKQKQLMPGEIILHEKELNNSLYFVNDGNLEIYSTLIINEKDDSLGTKFQQLQKKDVFGYEGFLLGEASSYSVKSSGSSIVSFIEKQVFLEILNQFPTDYEKFLFIKDQTVYGSVNTNVYKLKCISCGMTDHQLSKCPYISLSIKYKPHKQVNERSPYVRKRYRFSSLLKKIQFIQESAMEAQANNDQALIIEALNLLQSSVIKKSEKEEDIDQSASSLSLSVQINRHTIQNLDDLYPSLKDETQLKRIQSGVSLNHENFSRNSSKNIKSNENCSFINRDSKVISYKKERANEFDSHPFIVQQSQQQQHYSIFHSESQINSNEEQKEENSQKLESQKSINHGDQQQLIKQNMVRDVKSRTSSFHYNKNSELSPQRDKAHFDRNLSTNDDINTSQKTSLHQILKINNSQNKQAINKDFQETELSIIRQTFEERQKKSKQEYKQFQRELSQKIKLQNTPSLEDILSNSNKLQRVVKSLEKQKSNQNSQEENLSEKGFFRIFSLAAQGKFNNRKKSVTVDNLTMKENNDIPIQHSKQSLNASTQNTIQNYEILNNKVLNNVIENFQNTLTKKKVQEPQINSTEYQIRCKYDLQDIDMLLVRKQYILMQQKNLISDYIQVPDNEICIDSLHNYLYYYRAYNANNIIFKYNQKQFFKGKTSLSNKKRTTTQKKRQSKYLYSQIQKLNFQIKL